MSDTRYRTAQPDLAGAIQDIEQRLARLERVPRLTNAAIDKGALTVTDGEIVIRNGRLTVQDALNNITIVIGKLDDGSYDIAAYDIATGEQVRLAALAFGAKAAFDTNSCTRVGTFGDPTTGSAGPTVSNVLIGASGRCKVTMGAEFTVGFGNPQVGNGGRISIDVSGATSKSPSADYSIATDIQLQVTAGVGPALIQIVQRFSATHFFDDLNPGLHTFTMKYLCSGGGGQSAAFADRLLFIEPY